MISRLHNQNVDQVARATESHSYLRSLRIDATSRMTLRMAAEAAGLSSDEVLAQIDAAARRAARRAAAQPVVEVVEAEEEFELAY